MGNPFELVNNMTSLSSLNVPVRNFSDIADHLGSFWLEKFYDTSIK